jgi:hypothetical protein
MIEYNSKSSFASSASRTATFDSALRDYMVKVYQHMSIALVISGLVAFLVSSSPQLMQAIFEVAGKEYPLFLGFQFKDVNDSWNKYQGDMSFANLNFTYSDSNGTLATISDWDKLQDLVNTIFIAEFITDKALEELKRSSAFAIFPGDGFWYIAGDSLRKPSGNTNYFDILEMKLRDLFQQNL